MSRRKQKRGLPLRGISFSDDLLPNEALEHGDLDPNAFLQHRRYLARQIKTRG
jgi:D-methionine transport system substrate-binding protein